MKAITLWQPWATLIAIGAKQYETRGWGTNYRGWIAIHAAKRAEWVDQARLLTEEPFRSVLHEAGIYYWSDLPLGAVVAIGNLHNCGEIRACPRGSGRYMYPQELPVSEQEIAFGDWRLNRMAWCITGVRRLATPIPYRGFQGLWDVPPDLEKQINSQLAARV